MLSSPPIPQLNQDVLKFVDAETRANSAIIIYDNNDRIVWVSARQRSIANVTDYVSETHSSLFWLLLNAGKIGARVDRSDPAGWLEQARISRRQCGGMTWLAKYNTEIMAVSHRNFQDGYCVQSRVDIDVSCVIDNKSINDIQIRQTNTDKYSRYADKIDTLSEFSYDGYCLLNSKMEIIYANKMFYKYIDISDELIIKMDLLIDGVGVSDLPLLIHRAVDDANFRAVVPFSSGAGVMSISSGWLSGTALLVVSLPEHANADVLRQLLGIGSAEAAVAALVGAGLSPAEIAKARSTTEVTVYTQIRNLKEKIRKLGFPVSDLVGLSKLISRISSVTHLWK
ncbi:hypothetical protein [Azospirillum griseum]|uniref:HTH luxR-type domain-containing protein n=1 Tax=Azospirillum griseum TaxID=2496639 RepID=A0A3S0K7Y6_9PROT|nr:hypothetical protein [Azospirillum griseum]RTR24222.1 hypothetical protein EJ903_00060 [Azospirillum griseum]